MKHLFLSSFVLCLISFSGVSTAQSSEYKRGFQDGYQEGYKKGYQDIPIKEFWDCSADLCGDESPDLPESERGAYATGRSRAEAIKNLYDECYPVRLICKKL